MFRILPVSLVSLMTCTLLLTACGGGSLTPQEPSAPPAVEEPSEGSPKLPSTPPITTLAPQTLITTPGGALPITSSIKPEPGSKVTVTLKNIPQGVTIQAGDELSFSVPDTIATLITPASLAPGTYTLSAEITINDVTTSTPITLKIAAWRSYPLPHNTNPADIVSDRQGNAYVAASDCRSIERIERESGAVTTYKTPADQCFVGLDITPDTQLWTWDTTGSQITRPDPATGQVTPLPGSSATDAPHVMGDGTVWWFNRTTLNQFDPRTKTTRAYAVDTSTLGSFLTPQLTSPQISGDGYAWFIANGIPRQLGRLKLSSGVTEFFDQPFKFNLQNYVLTSQGPWLTYTPYQTNDTAVGQFDPVAKVLSKTLTPPQKYGFVGSSRLLALGENAVVFGQTGEGPASLTRINTLDGTSVNYWLTAQPTKIYDFALSTNGSIWTADLENDTVHLFSLPMP